MSQQSSEEELVVEGVAEVDPGVESDRFQELINEILSLRQRIDLLESTVFERIEEVSDSVVQTLESNADRSIERLNYLEENITDRLGCMLSRVEEAVSDITSHVEDSVQVTDESIRLLSTRVAERLKEIRNTIERQEAEYRDVIAHSVEDLQGMVEEFFARLEERLEQQIGEIMRSLEERLEEIRQLFGVYSEHLDKKHDALSEVQVLEVERVESLQTAIEALIKSNALIEAKTSSAEEAGRETLNYLSILKGVASNYEDRLAKLEKQVRDLLQERASRSLA